ncbi:MAG TPA: mevalonate kinase [Pseudogracilibacillus sp.]|nr:mevalonate kinase [Pseudogracilibacillus sp.]
MSVEKISMYHKMSVGTAYSKVILVGEHAVVHGQPAIAIPFPLIGVESTVEPIEGDIYVDSELYQGLLHEAPKALKGVADTIYQTLEQLELPKQGLFICIKSSIPPGKGLGSSASVAIAIVKSLFNYAGETYTNQDLLPLANISESYAHGAPSGIDSLAIASPCPIWYQKDEAAKEIVPETDFHFVVADTGQMADTKTAVSTVKQMLKFAPKKVYTQVERIGELTHMAKESLEQSSKQLLGFVLDEAQKELEALGVSNASLNRLIRSAKKEGALGAKLTGGGNGGCIIALARNEMHAIQIGEKLKKIGAAAVWPFVLPKQSES